jgi:hypothetical protein
MRLVLIKQPIYRGSINDYLCDHAYLFLSGSFVKVSWKILKKSSRCNPTTEFVVIRPTRSRMKSLGFWFGLEFPFKLPGLLGHRSERPRDTRDSDKRGLRLSGSARARRAVL